MIFFRNALSSLVGIIVGMISNICLIILGSFIIVAPHNMNPMDATNWSLVYFIFPFLAHSLGTLMGAVVASKISKNNSILVPMFVGLYFLFGGMYMAFIMPAPLWFLLCDLTLCYIPMALIGWNLSNL